TLIPNGIHHPPIEDGRLLPNSVKELEPRERLLFAVIGNTASFTLTNSPQKITFNPNSEN
ncbi:hypothetical protein, partial [Enterococcus faecium]